MKKPSKTVGKAPAIRPLKAHEVRAVSGGLGANMPLHALLRVLTHRPELGA